MATNESISTLPALSIADALRRVVAMQPLSEPEAEAVATRMVQGDATPAQVAAVLIALRMKGETVDELSGFVTAMRAAATPVPIRSVDAIDTCGTGGDGLGTFNISTVAAFVAAGAGCRIAKHGNRASSSKCGSADVLEALGVNVQMTPERSAQCVDEIGVGFLFAPQYHPGARFAAQVRREIGVRTVFNAVGPLANPAGVRRQLMGIYDARLTHAAAEVLRRHASTHVMVVCAADGLDEISLSSPTRVGELRDGVIRDYVIEPRELGLTAGPASDIAGGDAAYNANICREVLAGQRGAARDIVCLNAGAAIYVADRAATVADGVRMAAESIDSGRARQALERLVAAGRE